MSSRCSAALDTSAVWAQLTDVEKTALAVCMYRLMMAEQIAKLDPRWDRSYDAALVDACIPRHLTEAESSLTELATPQLRNLVTVRTAEIDHQVLEALNSDPGMRQVVILGAGLDPRAWRLHWPSGTHVFEVDTGAVEAIKTRVLGPMHMRAASRAFLRADLARARGAPATGAGNLAGVLKGEGCDLARPILWIAEGLIGYLSKEEGQELLGAMHDASAPGSKLVLTCPGVKFRPPFPHKTYAEPGEMLARVKAAGWEGQVNSAASLSEKYGTSPFTQDQIAAYKPAL